MFIVAIKTTSRVQREKQQNNKATQRRKKNKQKKNKIKERKIPLDSHFPLEFVHKTN